MSDCGPPAPCWRCGVVSTRMRVASSSGGWCVTEWCVSCDSSAVRDRAWVSRRGLDVLSLPVKPTRQGEEEREQPCAVCGGLAILEYHHLAPRAQFGADADRWPGVMVCRACHAEWHMRMGQPIGVYKGQA